MRLALASFTQNGAVLCARLAQRLVEQGHACNAYALPRHLAGVGAALLPLTATLGEWTAEHFAREDGIIFISAAGIAVRAIAPFVRDKTTDPAVVVVDEQGRFAVSLLSGHVGGANELAVTIARLLGAQAVVSTATDCNGLFAVDCWAREQNLFLADRAAAKRISAALLDGETVGFCSDFPVRGALPQGVAPQQEGGVGICISLAGEIQPFACTLRLTPRIVTVGIGCRKGISNEILEQELQRALRENNIDEHALKQVCSIDLKKEEPGLLELCAAHRLPLVTFSAAALREVAGAFTASAFVREITGVDNICERAAVLGSAAGSGKLLAKKQGANGVTTAFAVEEWSVQF